MTSTPSRPSNGSMEIEQSVVLDSFKLMRWLNARKLTIELAAQMVGVSAETFSDAMKADTYRLPPDVLEKLVRCLNVDVFQLVADGGRQPPVIVMTNSEIKASCRPIRRDGMHFYNYYSLPAPKGRAAPVILDILCPKHRLPQLNNGHLEPAITVNIGPGHINGRWGETLDENTWSVLAANKTGSQAWIVGDSYTEPSYCRHTYSLAGDESARIISYTIKSNLQDFLVEANSWSDDAFEAMVAKLGGDPSAANCLSVQMERRGYDAAALSNALSLSHNAVTSYLGGDSDALSVANLRDIGFYLGVDYRVFLPATHSHDKVGKTYCSVDDSIKTIRSYKSYTVASMAHATMESDLVGLYLKVDKPEPDGMIDLLDHAPSHYIVTMGKTSLRIIEDGKERTFNLEQGDAIWLGAFVQHAFFGDAALIKLGNGEGSSYLDQLQLSNTFNPYATLKQGRHDRQNWGYD
jgi:hypothetical protein